jgi:hypothetical protein
MPELLDVACGIGRATHPNFRCMLGYLGLWVVLSFGDGADGAWACFFSLFAGGQRK